jgi:hypothetical protein
MKKKLIKKKGKEKLIPFRFLLSYSVSIRPYAFHFLDHEPKQSELFSRTQGKFENFQTDDGAYINFPGELMY